MTEQLPAQPPEELPSPKPASNNTKWIVIIVGGGCALLACLGLVAALVVTFLLPRFRSVMPTTDLQPVVTVEAVPATDGTPSKQSAGVPHEGNTIGFPDAPVKIVEYADFQCPYCRRHAQETEPQIIEQYVNTGKVYYEYRSVGDFIGPESAAAAEAAYCAGDQDRFWDYHDTLYAHWTGENVGDFTQGKLLQYAAEIQLDPTAFYECLDSHKYQERVQQDAKDARADGVSATPSFLINGKLVEGALPFDEFQKAIEDALKGP